MKTLAAVLLLAATFATAAEPSIDPGATFVDAYIAAQKGEKLATEFSTEDAITAYREADRLLKILVRQYPAWNKSIVEYRVRRVTDALRKLDPRWEAEGSK